MGGRLVIGVLALQGAFAKHQEILESLGVDSIQVKHSNELEHCCGLILPGGESTTMRFQLQEMDLTTPLKTFAKHSPLFGTCAGMILMAQESLLSLLSISVERNAYGRQSDSFIASVKTTLSSDSIAAPFIRAPKLTAIHSPDVQVLAEHCGSPVLVQEGFHIAATFHPELTKNSLIHQYFIDLCKQKQSHQQLSKTISTKSSPSI